MSPTDAGALVLEARGLTVRYGAVNAVRDVSLEVFESEIVAIVGPNGAGKTMTIKLIMNLWRKDGGAIHIFGKDHLAHEIETRKQIGFVYDTPFFPPHITLQYLADTFAAAYPTWKRERFDELVRRFELPWRKVLKKFSRGMQMKACIATALSHEAKLLIMDEPTSSLSQHEVEVLFGVIAELKSRGVALIYITHKLEELARIGDDVTIMRDGRVVSDIAVTDRLNAADEMRRLLAAEAAAKLTA